MYELAFERCEEALDHSVVVAVSHAITSPFATCSPVLLPRSGLNSIERGGDSIETSII